MFAAVLLGPMLIAGGALAVRQNTARLEEELLSNAEAALAAPHPRPVHVDSPAPGTFGDAVALYLPPIQALSRETEPEREALRAVAAGTAEESSLSPSLRSALVRIGPALDGLLAGTHAARADLPPARESFVPVDGTTWVGPQFAATLAGVRVRRELGQGRPDAAVAACLDGLALARDAGIAGDLVGRMTATTIISRMVPACQAAFAAVHPSAARATLARLRVVRDALPSHAELLRFEFLSSDLFTFAPLLDEQARARLGPRAMAILKDGDRSTRLWERLVLRHSWHAVHRFKESLVQAAAAPTAMREEALARAEKAGSHWMNPIVHLQPSYLRYVRRAEAATRRLDALAFTLAARAFRAEHAAWPGGIGGLRGVGLVTQAEAERSGSARFDVVPSGGLRITVPLPQTDPAKDEGEVVLSLDAA